jgi:hypothetical protein
MAMALLVAAVLSACSSTQDVLEPSAITPPSETVRAADGTPVPTLSPLKVSAVSAQPKAIPAVATTTTASTSPIQTASIGSRAKIQFAPIVGTSVEAATALSERLSSRARERGIGLTGASDASTTHVLKGYFTPLTEGKQTTVIFVWDVYDPAGNRVHRISGQQKAGTKSGNGWNAVPDATMATIAEATIDQLAAWLANRTG